MYYLVVQEQSLSPPNNKQASFSVVIAGIIAPTNGEEIALAGVLDKKVCEIFPPEQVEVD